MKRTKHFHHHNFIPRESHFQEETTFKKRLSFLKAMKPFIITYQSRSIRIHFTFQLCLCLVIVKLVECERSCVLFGHLHQKHAFIKHNSCESFQTDYQKRTSSLSIYICWWSLFYTLTASPIGSTEEEKEAQQALEDSVVLDFLLLVGWSSIPSQKFYFIKLPLCNTVFLSMLRKEVDEDWSFTLTWFWKALQRGEQFE